MVPHKAVSLSHSLSGGAGLGGPSPRGHVLACRGASLTLQMEPACGPRSRLGAKHYDGRQTVRGVRVRVSGPPRG